MARDRGALGYASQCSRSVNLAGEKSKVTGTASPLRPCALAKCVLGAWHTRGRPIGRPPELHVANTMHGQRCACDLYRTDTPQCAQCASCRHRALTTHTHLLSPYSMPFLYPCLRRKDKDLDRRPAVARSDLGPGQRAPSQHTQQQDLGEKPGRQKRARQAPPAEHG